MKTEIEMQQNIFYDFVIELQKHDEIQQTTFYDFVIELQKRELQVYQSVMGMVYTLVVQDQRISELDAILKKTFPEYYNE